MRAMLNYPEIDPVAIALGPLKVHWYGVMYLLAFSGGWWLARIRAAKDGSGWSAEQVDDIVFYFVLGAVLGGRLGYTLFYSWSGFVADPLSLLRVWEGGMSFHGGLIGVLVAMGLFAKHQGKTFFQTTDFIAPFVPFGLFTGRIGNFINGELWGGPTDVPWGMRLPCVEFPSYCVGLASGAQWSLPVHPSQLYESLFEGVVLFLILWVYSSQPRPRMAISGMFLLGYGLFRLGVEFIRLPDAHIGYLAWGWVTQGQVLSLPMLFFGALFLVLAYKNKRISG